MRGVSKVCYVYRLLSTTPQFPLFNQLSECKVKWFERSCGRKLPSVVFCFDQNPNSSWCQSLFPCLTLHVQRNKDPCHPCPKSPQRCPGRILLKGDNICLMMNTGAWSEQMEKSRLMSLIAGHLLNDGKCLPQCLPQFSSEPVSCEVMWNLIGSCPMAGAGPQTSPMRRGTRRCVHIMDVDVPKSQGPTCLMGNWTTVIEVAKNWHRKKP